MQCNLTAPMGIILVKLFMYVSVGVYIVCFVTRRYHSQLEGGRVPVHAFTFQEPENDPRNCCYLWAVQSSQDL